jgi:signal transduction histidine kinase
MAMSQPGSDSAASLEAVDTQLERLAEAYVADGFTYRIRAEQMIGAADTMLLVAIGIALVAAVIVAAALRQAIIPPLQRAVAVADAIAGGKLDNNTVAAGRSETAHLLNALGAMQAALVAGIEARERDQAALLRQERLSVMGQLTATVAHELRNPLSAIRNTMHVIEDATVRSGLTLARPLARIERSILRCDRLISDLLDFARSRELRRETVALDSWLGNMLDDQPMPEHVSLERRFDAATAKIAIDCERFYRAILNLVENSLQAMGEQAGAEGKITVATVVAESAVITIEDSGPGIAPEVLPKIFEPLFSTKGFGSGLGLPTVKQIVENHGGTIRITSKPGRGTTARIELPLADDSAALHTHLATSLALH